MDRFVGGKSLHFTDLHLPMLTHLFSVPAEVYPNAVRAKGVGFAIAVNWLSNFVIGWVVPPMFAGIGYGTYIFFACFCFLAFAFGYFLVPETSGKSLEEIDVLFGDCNGVEEEEAKREVLRGLK